MCHEIVRNNESSLYTSSKIFTSVQGGNLASYAQAVDNSVENFNFCAQLCA